MNARSLAISVAAAALLVCTATAGAATSDRPVGKAELNAAQARYKQDVAVCNSGHSNQDRATCLREAGAALANARRGLLDDGGANYQRNQSQRCTPLPQEQRADCIARMQGGGTTSGSVAGGGVYRELVTVEVGAVPADADHKPAATPR